MDRYSDISGNVCVNGKIATSGSRIFGQDVWANKVGLAGGSELCHDLLSSTARPRRAARSDAQRSGRDDLHGLRDGPGRQRRRDGHLELAAGGPADPDVPPQFVYTPGDWTGARYTIRTDTVCTPPG